MSTPAACAALVGLAAQLALCRAAGSSRPASRTGPSLGARDCVRTVPVHVCAGRAAVGHHGCGPHVDTAQPACLRSGVAQRRRVVGLAQLVAKCRRWSRGHSESSLFPGWPGQSAACHRGGIRPPHTASCRWIPFAATHKSLKRIRQICPMDALTAVAQARILLGAPCAYAESASRISLGRGAAWPRASAGRLRYLDLIKEDQLLGRQVISSAPSAVTRSAVVAAMPAGRAGPQGARPGSAIDAVPG